MSLWGYYNGGYNTIPGNLPFPSSFPIEPFMPVPGSGGGPTWWQELINRGIDIAGGLIPGRPRPPGLPPGRMPPQLPGMGGGRIPTGPAGRVARRISVKTMAKIAAAAAALGISVAQYISQYGVPRSSRRMNVANVKALRRSMRRVGGFAKLAGHTISFTRRVKMKKRKRS